MISNRYLPPSRPQHQTPTYQNLIAECDELTHIQDTPLFPAIRHNKLVEVAWNELTDAERRQAYTNAFYTYSYSE